MANSETKSKSSIVHIIDRLYTGGAERVLVTLANVFHQHGHKVRVITIVEEGPLATQLLLGVEHINLDRRFKFDTFTMHKLITHVKGFDVVHVHSFFNLRYLWLAKQLFGLKQQIFYHEHFGFRAKMQPTFMQKIVLPKTIFIATTAQINAWAVDKLNMPQKKVFTLPNIVLKEDINSDEQYHGVKTGKQLVIVSNLRSEKNIEFAIMLLQFLNRDGAGYHLTIIGKLSNLVYQSKLLQLAEETKTTNNITWVHNANNVQQLLGEFDLGIHTSPSESGPLAVIEYLAQGLPFVVYNTGEVIATINPLLPQCIAYSFDVSEWEHKILQLKATSQNLLRQQLQTVFEKHFSAEAYYQQCVEIYSSTTTT